MDSFIPVPISALDGASDLLPNNGTFYQTPKRGPALLCRRSSRHLRSGLDCTVSTSLKHHSSNPGFIRKRLSQHFQGTVIRRPSTRPTNILVPALHNLNSGLNYSISRHYNIQTASTALPRLGGDGASTHPMLRTVEVTTAAKIYLESHFSQLLTFPTSRSVRRRNFESHLQKRLSSEHDRRILREEWMQKETEYLRSLRNHSLSVGNYEIVKVIGRGAFGVVKLVREKNNQLDALCGELNSYEYGQSHLDSHASGEDLHGENEHNTLVQPTAPTPQFMKGTNRQRVFAMKVMKKAEMLIGGQEGHLRAERDFLVASQGSRWIVPLVLAFQDQDNLYAIRIIWPCTINN